VSFEHPRARYYELPYPAWGAALPPAWTLFIPPNGRVRGVYDEIPERAADEEAPAITSNTNNNNSSNSSNNSSNDAADTGGAASGIDEQQPLRRRATADSPRERDLEAGGQ
jgi:hypothetical protein